MIEIRRHCQKADNDRTEHALEPIDNDTATPEFVVVVEAPGVPAVDVADERPDEKADDEEPDVSDEEPDEDDDDGAPEPPAASES